jgi:hypothetical protein
MGAFQNWKRECEEIEKEMDRLITAGRPDSAEERQVRQLQFTALIERRDAAARSLLHADTAGRRHKPFGLSSQELGRSRSLRGEPSVLFQLADALQVFVPDAAHAAPAGPPFAQPFHLVGMELGAVQSAEAVEHPLPPQYQAWAKFAVPSRSMRASRSTSQARYSFIALAVSFGRS